MVRKVLAIMIVFLVLSRILVLPRFARARAKLDRLINATIFALILVYGIALLRAIF